VIARSPFSAEEIARQLDDTRTGAMLPVGPLGDWLLKQRLVRKNPRTGWFDIAPAGRRAAKQWIPAFAQSGASPPDAQTTNYTIHVVRFRVVREPGAPRTRRTPLSTPSAVAALAAQIIPDDAREHFGVLMLDTQNRLVVYHAVSTGTLSASLVHPREVFGPALRVMGVASIILVHNHPSGEPTPSREDLRLTQQLVEAGQLLDITVHDHVIVGADGAYVSFADRGLL